MLKFEKKIRRQKVKVHPRRDHEGPEGEERYSFTLPSTSALDRSGWSAPRLGALLPGKDPVLIVQEAGWAAGPVWTGAENLAPDRPARRESLYRPSYPAPPPPRMSLLNEMFA